MAVTCTDVLSGTYTLSDVRGLLAHPDSLSRPGLLARVLLRSVLAATR
jgi:hypothetical protein